MIALKVAPRYIVPENIPTPVMHSKAAIRVAYGIRVIQATDLLAKKEHIYNTDVTY